MATDRGPGFEHTALGRWLADQGEDSARGSAALDVLERLEVAQKLIVVALPSGAQFGTTHVLEVARLLHEAEADYAPRGTDAGEPEGGGG